MFVVFLGPPGAGKGTQAKIYSEKLAIPHVAPGDIFRQVVKKGGEKAALLKSYMEAGKLVPDSVVMEIVFDRLSEPDCEKGFILDGFPRTLEQAEGLDRFLREREKKLDLVVYFEISLPVLIRRLSGRRVCSSCQAPYHIETYPPKKKGICDLCGGELITRKDDTEEAIQKRFEEFEKQTKPLLAYYQERGILVKIFAGNSIKEVEKELEAAFAAGSK